MTSPQLSEQERHDAVVEVAEINRQQAARQQQLVQQAAEEDAVVAALSRRASVRRTTTPIAVVKIPDIEVPLTEDDPPYKMILKDGQPQMVPFQYRLRPPERDERKAIEKRNTRQEPDKQLGRALMRDIIDDAQVERELLYTCTVPQDKQRFWDNPKLQQVYGAGDGIDLVGKFHNDRQQQEAILVLFALQGGVEDERTRLKG